ncbi:DinB family protein [Spirosoma pollinicola]|nr:DinB family protein [Spirosoma pollinicola]
MIKPSNALFCILLWASILSCYKQVHPPTVRTILLEQLKNTHTNEDWFTPLKKATGGLTAIQANWRDSTVNHSIGQLVSHLIFWSERVLTAFQGNTAPDFSGNNEETFERFTNVSWDQAIVKLDSIQIKWYQSVEKATDKQLAKWSSSVANICSHNAYHTGQIIYIRKKNRWWPKPEEKK